MAMSERRHVVVNPAGEKKSRRLTPKQIQYFGSPAQKAALKRKRRAAFFKGRQNAARQQQQHRKAARQPAMSRNPGEILSLTLNPGEVKTMAQTKKKSAGARQHTRKNDPDPRRHTGGKKSGHHFSGGGHRPRGSRGGKKKPKQHNPAGVGGRTRGIGRVFTNALFIITGAVGSKLITQAVLGSKNVGLGGYLGNAGSGIGISLLGGWLLKSEEARNSLLAGTAVQIVLRMIVDYTPFGKYTKELGVGDYQVSNYVTPQRYVNALESAEVEIPAGWAPRVIQAAPAAAAAAAGAAAGMSGGGGLYSGGNGLY